MRSLSGLSICITWLVLAAGCAGPVSPEGRQALLAAHQAYNGGNDAQAVRQADRFLQMHPRLPEAAEAYYIRGLARCRSGQLPAGKADLQAAIAATRRKDLIVLAHDKLGELAYQADDLARAETYYRAVLDHGRPGAPPADQAMYRLGCILQRKGRWKEADLLFHRLRFLFGGTALAKRASQRVGATCWSVQAGAFSQARAAGELLKRLEARRLTGRVDLELRQGRLLHLVRVGSHATYDAARADLAKVKPLCPDAFISPAG